MDMEFGTWRYATFMGIAKDLARSPRARYDVNLQEQICNRHDVSLDDLTDSELELLGQMTTEYASCY